MSAPLRLVMILASVAPLAAQIPGQSHVQNSCGVLHVSSGAACPPGLVTAPAGWHSGDSHEHIQHCFSGTDDTPATLYAEMQAEDLDVLNPLIWAAGFITPDEYKVYTNNYVTGSEDPITAADPSRIIQFGVETSGISCGNLGHMIGLNITHAESDVFQYGLGCTPLYPTPGWKNDGSGDYSKPIFDLFRQAPGAVTGYAHQSWPVDLHVDQFLGGWDWEDPLLPAYVGFDANCSFGMDMAFPVPKACGNTHPVLAPFDAALGRIDFVESFNLLDETCPPLEERYFGLYYRLLNAGQFVALSAGTDADCIGFGCEPRVWVKLRDGDAFNYDNWTRALALGRTSISVGQHQFLDLTVDAQVPGDTASVSSPGSGSATVSVNATYVLDIQDSSTVTDTIEIIQNGVVIASQAFGPMGTGTHVFRVNVPVTQSGWIAARTGSYKAHTGAVMVRLDGKPTAICAEAEYWTLYADFLNWTLDVAAASSPTALEFYAGCSEAEIRDYIEDGRNIYAAVRDYASPSPMGIWRYGSPTASSCALPPGIVTDQPPVASQSFKLRYFNAPPTAAGGLILSTVAQPQGLPLLGAMLFLLPNPSLEPMLTQANEGGYGAIVIPQMPPVAGIPVHVQYAWLNPPGCNANGILSSSEAMTITIQP